MNRSSERSSPAAIDAGSHPDRRRFVRTAFVGGLAAGSAVASASGASRSATTAERTVAAPREPGRVRQSICRWCYGGMPLEALCALATSIGYGSIELLGEAEWPVVAAQGLSCAVANGPTTIARGFNRPAHHDDAVREGERLLPLVAAAKIPQMIVFSGNRDGMSDAEGLRHCAAGLRRLTPLAESLGVTLVMELLNSKVDHRDYMADRTAWGVALVEEVGSLRFRLLYDIYHMQIMEGDVIRTIRDSAHAIAHYHTGGVPGRREIDGSQELNYPAICRAIVETGFTGYLGQEFIPSRDPQASLREAFEICRGE
ncbi:MAG TPA: TIM barrel protein [Phycisphaerales bacterium]|nr:TIM barrel protein [Phycisphaerales bacterium]HMP37773.1 TIM barrel protein [Phycisphaerales bacterium]